MSFLHFKVIYDGEHTDDLEGEFAGSLLFIRGRQCSCQINPIHGS